MYVTVGTKHGRNIPTNTCSVTTAAGFPRAVMLEGKLCVSAGIHSIPKRAATHYNVLLAAQHRVGMIARV